MINYVFKLFLSLVCVLNISFISPAFALEPRKNFQESQEILLTGYDLTLEEVARIARNPIPVKVDPAAWERVHLSHQILLKAAKEEIAVYGLNRGVGLNKDKKIFNGDTLTPEAKEASISFNKNILYSTSAAAGPELSAKIVFPLMLIRLNMILQGKSGAQPKVAELLVAFINKRIQPIIPSVGSIGEADITILSHLGLAMMGEGDVYFEGERMSAKEALDRAGLEPLVPYGKDALSILSSNAYSAAMGALILHDTEELLNKADFIFALSLEGLNGNIAPFLSEVQEIRPYVGQQESAANIRKALKGSYLWEVSSLRELQDPLSFRSTSQVHGAVRDLLKTAKQKLLLHINSSDDNPAVVIDPSKTSSSEQEKAYTLKEHNGSVIPTANFEAINWVIDFEALGIGLSHLSRISAQRTIKLSEEKFTKLTRFLSPDPKTIAFGAIQKTFVALDTEIRALSNPVSADYFPVAGEIEDHATNAPMVMQRLCKILTNLHTILGIELMHSSQAVDLRKRSDPKLKLGCITNEELHAFREKVPFLDKDRMLTEDIRKATDFVSSFWSQKITCPDCLFKDKSIA